MSMEIWGLDGTSTVIVRKRRTAVTLTRLDEGEWASRLGGGIWWMHRASFRGAHFELGTN